MSNHPLHRPPARVQQRNPASTGGGTPPRSARRRTAYNPKPKTNPLLAPGLLLVVTFGVALIVWPMFNAPQPTVSVPDIPTFEEPIASEVVTFAPIPPGQESLMRLELRDLRFSQYQWKGEGGLSYTSDQKANNLAAIQRCINITEGIIRSVEGRPTSDPVALRKVPRDLRNYAFKCQKGVRVRCLIFHRDGVALDDPIVAHKKVGCLYGKDHDGGCDPWGGRIKD